MPKKIRRFWMASAVLLLVAAGSVAAVRLWPRMTVSDLYRVYADQPGIDATFLRNFPLNDTLKVDVTLLQATDSAGWERLKEEFGMPELPESYVNLACKDKDLVITYIASSDYKSAYKGMGVEEDDMIAGAYKKKQISVFHLENEQQQNAVLHYNIRKSLKKQY